MYPPIREDVFAALVEAVRRWPNRWSLQAQAIIVRISAWLTPDNIERSLDVVEAIVAGSVVVVARGRPNVARLARLVIQSSGPPRQECRVLPFSRRRGKQK